MVVAHAMADSRRSCSGGNPVFRVYDIDPDTYEVMDFTPYYSQSRPIANLLTRQLTMRPPHAQPTNPSRASTSIPCGSHIIPLATRMGNISTLHSVR